MVVAPNPFTVFIGHDPAQPENSRACYNSIRAHDSCVRVEFIRKDELIDRGWYWRPKGTETTDFAFTRFLVPFLKGYHGKALFCDSDFIWQCSPAEVLEDAPHWSWAVACVKHDMPRDSLPKTKMGGKPQNWYLRKNWASLMLFDCEHPYNILLTPKAVSEEDPSWLFGLRWAGASVAGLDKKWNYLVGYNNREEVPSPKAIHYTNGTPMYPEYADCEYADLWRKHAQP